VESGFTWYDILGVVPASPAHEIRGGYDAKAMLLRPELLAGAPSAVLAAARRAQQILDAAWWVLGDVTRREAYDEAVGVRRVGEGLGRRQSDPSVPGWDSSDFGLEGGSAAAELMGGLTALTEAMAPHPQQPHRIIVPDLRGLFYRECLDIVGRIGFRVATVRLTEHPMPVEGLVVGQAPAAQEKAHRESTLTVHVWHPPRRAG
jgi:curved DNA-binding protein CbpA